jgi:hypothetical protein
MKKANSRKQTSATHVVASTFGVLIGLAGINHGVFEIAQGNVVPDSLLIAAIGPEQRFWEYGLEPALTIVPSYLVTGILAVMAGLAVMVWAAFFLDWKHGPGGLMLLSALLFLVGGGFAPPIFMGIPASLAATRIEKPLIWWPKRLPDGVFVFLGRLWPEILSAFVLVFVISVVIAIFGWPLTLFFDANTALNYLNNLAYLMIALILMSVLAGFAHDSQHQSSSPELIPLRERKS